MKIVETLNEMSIGKLIFYAFVIGSAFTALVSCLSGNFWATSIISNWINVHVFNVSTKIYFEVLIWTLFVTSVQFYKYYSYTLGLYDDIAVSRSSIRVKFFHVLLQLLLSIVIFLAALVLCATIFLAIMTIEIMNEHSIDISWFFELYFPFLRLDFLLLYFVLMDILLLIISFNFASCPECDEEKKNQFRSARKSIVLSLIFGTVLFGISWLLLVIDPIATSSYHRVDNLETKFSSISLLICLGLLQLLYVVIDFYFEVTGRGLDEVSPRENP